VKRRVRCQADELPHAPIPFLKPPRHPPANAATLKSMAVFDSRHTGDRGAPQIPSKPACRVPLTLRRGSRCRTNDALDSCNDPERRNARNGIRPRNRRRATHDRSFFPMNGLDLAGQRRLLGILSFHQVRTPIRHVPVHVDTSQSHSVRNSQQCWLRSSVCLVLGDGLTEVTASAGAGTTSIFPFRLSRQAIRTNPRGRSIFVETAGSLPHETLSTGSFSPWNWLGLLPITSCQEAWVTG